MNRFARALVRPTGTIWFYAGLLPWLAIAIRCFGTTTVLGCCFLLFFFLLVLCVLPPALGVMARLPWTCTSFLQERLYRAN